MIIEGKANKPSLFFFNWRLITLQYCNGFCHTLKWISHEFTCVPHPETPSHLPPHPISLDHPSKPALSTLSHPWNLDWQSVSYMIIHMFQCYSLISSHPCLLPQSPKDCSIHLCLFCCLAYRVIDTIFLNPIYICSVRSVQSTQSCLTLCNSMICNRPGLPVHHQLPEFTQTHIHQVSDAIQPSHPLLSPSPPAPTPSQQQSLSMSQLFAWGGQSNGVSASASFLPKKSQGWSPSEWTRWISLQSKGLSGVFSNTTVQKHQFFSAQPSSQSNSHIHTWPLEKT